MSGHQLNKICYLQVYPQNYGMLSSFEHHDSFIFQVKENKALRFMRYKRAKISPNKNVPMRRPSRVKFRFNTLCTCQT